MSFMDLLPKLNVDTTACCWIELLLTVLQTNSAVLFVRLLCGRPLSKIFGRLCWKPWSLCDLLEGLPSV